MKNLLYILLISMVVGCSNAHINSQGSVINLIPVKYQYDLTLKDASNFETLQRDSKEYIYKNITELVKRDIELKSYSKEGELLLDNARELLLSLGVSPKKITVIKSSISETVDFSLIMNKYEAQVPVCRDRKTSAYGEDDFGCTVDSLRWASIVSPEKMLPQNSRSIPLQE
ncbi:hypothetical protein O1D97_14905 [Marinomonas sp. 15G1-11]|uniref:Pilus assembly protein CpaD n=1 Tax=Marinomonas phaeophyticola TaxID=3004091 RepID=A0ABT4JWW0_9GAMM|nr:hypothetical protein [Marinomonas sp. 15G1-11]MCZ2722862.1 hypothetical protein [Marinomonas sp. 15G1-11]